jgi:hypothetical protein
VHEDLTETGKAFHGECINEYKSGKDKNIT